jgi:hypothetical protein
MSFTSTRMNGVGYDNLHSLQRGARHRYQPLRLKVAGVRNNYVGCSIMTYMVR